MRVKVSFPCRLANQQRPYPVQSKHLLVLPAFDQNESHRWSSHRVANGLGIFCIVLVRFHVRADEARTHELYFMPQFCDLPRSVVRPTIGLHSHQTGLELRHEWQQFSAPKLARHYRPAIRVDSREPETDSSPGFQPVMASGS